MKVKLASGTPPRDTRQNREWVSVSIKSTLPSNVLTAMAPATIVNVAGECGENQGVPFVDINNQRHCWQACARGVAQSDQAYIDKAVDAIEYGFANMNPDGSFPGGSDAFDTLGFLEAALRCEQLLSEDGRSTAGITPYHANMATSIGWLFGASQVTWASQWNAVPRYCNSLGGLIILCKLGGKFLNDASLTRRAQAYIDQLLSLQTSEGWWPDGETVEFPNGGHDSNYTAVLLWRISEYLSYTNPEDNPQLVGAAIRGWAWEGTKILVTGEISTAGNSRVIAPAIPNYPECIMGMWLWSKCLPDPTLGVKAQTVYDYAASL